MANYATLKAAVADVVKTNGSQAITGANLQSVLLSIINSVGGGGYIFKGVATPSINPGTPDQNVFYIGGAGTYANFGTSVVVPPTNIAVFKYNGTWNCEQLTVENGGVFDISAFKAVGGTLATYADLAAALGTNGANVPESVRKGGMSIKFVQSSDNKYVQYRYTLDDATDVSDFINTDNWSFCGGDVYVENPEFIVVGLDKNKRILFGVQKDGNFYFGAGVPKQVVDYVISQKEEILAIVSTKVDKEDGKTLMQSELAESVKYVDNPEFIDVELDKNNKILGGRRADGTKFENMPFENPAATKEAISDPEGRFSIELDRNNRILSYRDNQGVLHEIAGIVTKTIHAHKIDVETDIRKTIYIYDRVAKIENGNIYNYGDFEDAPMLEHNVYGTIKITGLDTKVEFYNERPDSINILTVELLDGVEKEILIPSYFQRIKVGTVSGTPVTQTTKFRLVLSYKEEDYKMTEYVQKLYERNKYLPIVTNLKRTIVGAGNKPSLLYKTLSVAAITDIHDNRVGTRKFLDFVREYSDYIDDAIGLGDYQNGALDDNLEIDQYEGWNNILKVIGNHDAYHDWIMPEGYPDYVVEESVCYNAFMAGHIQDWGVVYQVNKTYYYKDYVDAKIRMIFLDYMHWDEINDLDGQKAWLQNILYGDGNIESAAALGYHVVICVHSRPKSELSGDIVPFENCPFVALDKFSNLCTVSDFDCTVPDIVNTFQTIHGGNFICYLCGHYHVDFIGTYENYPKQITIVQACSAAFEFVRDSTYPWDTDYTAQFSLYSFDSDSKLIRIYRVGANYNRNLQHKESALIGYGDNVKLLSCF